MIQIAGCIVGYFALFGGGVVYSAFTGTPIDALEWPIKFASGFLHIGAGTIVGALIGGAVGNVGIQIIHSAPSRASPTNEFISIALWTIASAIASAGVGFAVAHLTSNAVAKLTFVVSQTIVEKVPAPVIIAAFIAGLAYYPVRRCFRRC